MDLQLRGRRALVTGSSKYDMVTELRLLQQFKERRVAGIILTGFVFDATWFRESTGTRFTRCLPVARWQKSESPGSNPFPRKVLT